jgi:hypothetical protein
VVLAPLACSVVLAASGIAKTRDTDATREAFRAMSVPEALRGEAVVRLLPYVEISLAVLLLATWSWWLALVAAATTVLFATYWVLVLRVVKRGEAVACGCFGAVGDDRVTGWTLARNSALLVLAALATTFGAAGSGLPTVVRGLNGSDLAWLVMSAAVAAVAVLVVARGSDTSRPEDQEPFLDYDRREIPFALLAGSDGERTTLRQLAMLRPQLLVFLSSSCGSCTEVAARLPEWRSRLAPVEIQAVYTHDLAHLPRNVVAEQIPAWFDIEQGATNTFAPNGRPAAVLLGVDGLLAGGPVAGTIAIMEFVEDIVAELAENNASGNVLDEAADRRDEHGRAMEHDHDHQH